ncbi:MAG: hypothetical protein ACM3ZE_03130, partial [Myxococcales bacterium]
MTHRSARWAWLLWMTLTGCVDRVDAPATCPATQPATGDACTGTQRCLYDITTKSLYEGQFNCAQLELAC